MGGGANSGPSGGGGGGGATKGDNVEAMKEKIRLLEAQLAREKMKSTQSGQQQSPAHSGLVYGNTTDGYPVQPVPRYTTPVQVRANCSTASCYRHCLVHTLTLSRCIPQSLYNSLLSTRLTRPHPPTNIHVSPESWPVSRRYHMGLPAMSYNSGLSRQWAGVCMYNNSLWLHFRLE